MPTQEFAASVWRLAANHLWQSTLFAAVVWLLTLALRKNRAAVRYWLWLAASVKFLIPFSLLVSAGAQLGWRTAPAVAQPRFPFVMEEIAQPFAAGLNASAAGCGCGPEPDAGHSVRNLALRRRDWHGFLAAVVAADSRGPARGDAAGSEPADTSNVLSRSSGAGGVWHS